MDLVNIGTLVIAVSAVGISVWEGCTNRKHNRLSVRPCLSYSLNMTGSDGYVGIRLKNVGFGPAIIRHVFLSLNGKDMGEVTVEVWSEVKKALGIDYNWIEFTSFRPGGVLGGGDSKNVFCLNDPEGDANKKKQFESALHKFTLEAKYESLYGESWSAFYTWPAK